MDYIVRLLGLLTCHAMLVWCACPTGWMRFDDSCYKIFKDDHQNWANALKKCNATMAHLAVVQSDPENNFLMGELRKLKNVPSGLQFWMDGTDQTLEGDWVWEHTGDHFEVKHFYPGEPNQNGGNEDCLAFFARYNFLWNDEHCTSSEGYICEIEDYPDIVG